MPYSKSLAARVRQALAGQSLIVEKKMFGGVVFLLRGNILVGVWQDALIVRLGVEAAEPALKEEFVRPFDVTGSPMRGWAMVDAEGLDSDVELARWIERAQSFVDMLPAK